MLKKLKKNGNKGFTLVELIVVLVILAILAALLIPALTGYIDKAKQKQIIAETRQAVMAAQTLVDEAYAKKDLDGVTEGTDTDVLGTSGPVQISKDDIAALAEVTADNITSVKVTVEKAGATGTNSKLFKVVISELVYTKAPLKCTYNVDADPDKNEEKYTVEPSS
ncbi:prepilin-type N-terminal cleavage/methylation domain-containing protein [uncultured Oscillibacter sp.]|uniref:prepilin-type N-terminal cleavage/methylation domain-containing protein n=1 Tax=uncultured Oscillibacter sp. TaxID=876091 RepID=UPI00272C832B|nr:prepilin-type N-terminal cleavage/methylation domain-containing protein [uncultured Oscillibacter sp.]